MVIIYPFTEDVGLADEIVDAELISTDKPWSKISRGAINCMEERREEAAGELMELCKIPG